MHSYFVVHGRQSRPALFQQGWSLSTRRENDENQIPLDYQVIHYAMLFIHITKIQNAPVQLADVVKVMASMSDRHPFLSSSNVLATVGNAHEAIDRHSLMTDHYQDWPRTT
jgi:hypothetical protein